MFFKIDVLKIFAIFTEKHLSWPLQAFFYRTPTVAASRFSWQQILFPAESGIYCWRSHRFLLRTPFRNSHQRCSIEIGVLRNFTKFTGKHLCQSLFFNKVAAQTLAQVFSCEFCEIFKNILFYRTPQGDCFYPMETRVKRQKQPLKLPCKKRCF